jgi:thioesterase domain-containing protein
LAAVEITQAVGVTHGAFVQPNELISSPTPRLLAARISAAIPSDSDGIVVANANGSATPLHVVAGAGGPAVQYHGLAMALGHDQPVVVHEQAGLHARWPIDLSVTAAARRHVEVIARRWPDGAVVLCGHSYGGVVANVMATMLAERGREVELIVLDVGLPSGTSRLRRIPDRTSPLRRRLWAPIRLRLSNARRWVRVVTARPDSVKRYNAMILPGTLQAVRHRGVAFGGPTTVVAAAERTLPLFWPAADHVGFVIAPGDHNSMLTPPHVVALAEVITTILQRHGDVQGRADVG